MIHKMKLQKGPFEAIKGGLKRVEMRLFDEKRQLIKVGDEIEFTLFDGSQCIICLVVGIVRFDNFSELYSYYDKGDLGYKENQMAHPVDMAQYYDDTEIEKYGVVGIEIKLKANN